MDRRISLFASILPVLVLSCFAGPVYAATIPDPVQDAALVKSADAQEESIVLAGGCFWGIEAVFEHLKGVKNAVSGYAGGTADTAKYNLVSGGDTGHAEVVRVTYDPAVITTGQILKVFFAVAHDPTQLNRQGPDHGTQYRSAIFYTTPAQHDIARAYIAQLDKEKIFPDKIVTQVNALDTFYPAETYHQDFAQKNPAHPYIVVHDLPKVISLKRTFPDLYVSR